MSPIYLAPGEKRNKTRENNFLKDMYSESKTAIKIINEVLLNLYLSSL